MRGTLAKRRNRIRQRSARIAGACKQNRDQDPINKATEQARAEEIAARKFRNHLRDMLFLSKGAPSASPFCTGVNDPREPEQLPPGLGPRRADAAALAGQSTL